MKFELDYIEELAELVNKKNLSEICIEDGGKKIVMKKENSLQITPQQKAKAENVVINEEKILVSDKRTPITSPMVGTFYASPSPDKEPYVSVGDEIKAGDTVCIIEAMKLLNEIETDISGRVVEICVENGQTIEFGQTLMYVE